MNSCTAFRGLWVVTSAAIGGHWCWNKQDYWLIQAEENKSQLVQVKNNNEDKTQHQRSCIIVVGTTGMTNRAFKTTFGRRLSCLVKAT
jgi:hypothetical protein